VIVRNLPGHSFSAFVIRGEPGEQSVYKDDPVQVTYGSSRNLIAYFRLLRYAWRNRGDIFHVFNIGPVFLLLLRMGQVKRIIYSIHGTIYWNSGFQKILFRVLWSLALSKKITFLANSEHSRSVFHAKVSKRVRIELLYNPIDTRRFTPTHPGRKKEEPLVIYSGRLEKGKNLEKWIATAAGVHEVLPQTKFEIYGRGSLKQDLQGQVDALGANDYIQIKGFRGDIENVYREADAFLFLSGVESFGNVVVESILCGTPVITASLPVMKEIFRDHPEFMLNGSDDLTGQVLRKLSRLEELKQLTTDARKSFIDRFSAEKHIQSLQEIYNRV
jgi:glycosyltransferase involved in cell wall biosynthesis